MSARGAALVALALAGGVCVYGVVKFYPLSRREWALLGCCALYAFLFDVAWSLWLREKFFPR